MNNQQGHDCPTRTIINAVFGTDFDKVPKEIADEVKACKRCFVIFYGEHLTEKTLNSHMDQFSLAEDFHFGHCPECAKRYFEIHPRPNKMGRSSQAYLNRIGTP